MPPGAIKVGLGLSCPICSPLTTLVQPGGRKQGPSVTGSPSLQLLRHPQPQPTPKGHPQVRVRPTFPTLLGLSLALEAALSRQGGAGGGHSCRTPLKSVG